MAAETDVHAPLENGRATQVRGSNVILLGAMGSGKSTVGWLLARLIGYGFIDLDAFIERRVGRTVDEIFEQEGESRFREIERQAVQDLRDLKCHVLSVGGGAVVDDDNWDTLREMGITVWLDTPPAEIARRLLRDPAELKKRPLLRELADEQDKHLKLRLLTERLSALLGQRIGRYREADLAVSDGFSTPESSAKLLRRILIKDGTLKLATDARAIDRWGAF